MSKKVPYESLAPEVDKLYPPHYVLKDGETIEEHLLFIETFITSCGWTTEDFMEEYLRRGLSEQMDKLFPDPKKMN